MSSQELNRTANLSLTQFTATDTPSWLNDYNSDMFKIDAAIDEIKALIYPVGSIYISIGNQSPANFFGFGTWERFGKGKVIVGVDENDTMFASPGMEGGNKNLQQHGHTMTHTHTHAHTHSMAHTHTTQSHWSQDEAAGYGLGAALGFGGRVLVGNAPYTVKTNASSAANTGGVSATNTGGASTANTSNAGNGDSQNLQPYITAYMWVRMA